VPLLAHLRCLPDDVKRGHLLAQAKLRPGTYGFERLREVVPENMPFPAKLDFFEPATGNRKPIGDMERLDSAVELERADALAVGD
jgi:hypothetical protein